MMAPWILLARQCANYFVPNFHLDHHSWHPHLLSLTSTNLANPLTTLPPSHASWSWLTSMSPALERLAWMSGEIELAILHCSQIQWKARMNFCAVEFFFQFPVFKGNHFCIFFGCSKYFQYRSEVEKKLFENKRHFSIIN